MTHAPFAAAILAASLLFAAAARAETLRYPESGDPAFVVAVPDGWEHKTNREGDLVVFNPPHTASLTFTIGDLDGTLDELASHAASTPEGMPPASKGSADISGYHGFAYDSTLVSGDGVHANVHLLLVKLDDGHFAGATLLTADGIKDDDFAAARTVFESATLTAVKVEAPPPAPEPPAAPPPPQQPTPPAPEAAPAPAPTPPVAPAATPTP